MAGPTKRTRASLAQQNDENELPTPSPSPSAPSTPSRRRVNAPAGPSNSSETTPSPSRPILTRSATLQPSTRTPLTRSASMFTPSTRRSANSDFSPLPSPVTAGSSSTGARGGMLTRTQSTTAIPSPTSMKSTVAPSGGPGRGKGDDGPDFEARGAKGLGKGKENIPPKNDPIVEEGSSRKRIRVARRSSASTSASASARARSGSVSSMRSEGAGKSHPYPPSSSLILRPSCICHTVMSFSVTSPITSTHCVTISLDFIVHHALARQLLANFTRHARIPGRDGYGRHDHQRQGQRPCRASLSHDHASCKST